MLITENQLDHWVQGNSRDAQGLIVELIERLVAASCPRPRDRRFPLGDSIGQHGPDGVVEVDIGFDPFVPEGRSFWAIGTGGKPGKKATSDYKDFVKAIPVEERQGATFVFVTPLSGAREWEYSWKQGAQASWLAARRRRGEWKDVRVIDGTKLVSWVQEFPAVGVWLAHHITGASIYQIEIPSQRWEDLRAIGDPPPLTSHLFLINRDEAQAKFGEILADTSKQLKLDTLYPDQVVDFVCAYLTTLEDEDQLDAAGRCLIVSGVDAWRAIVGQRERHILIAAATLDLTDDTGMMLIQKARRAGHAVIFGGGRGGAPDPTSAPLRTPSIEQIREALSKAGYTDQRARMLSQKSGGNLGSLLRCLQNLSLLPTWADGSPAADLAIAALLGGWNEGVAADQAAVEDLAGNSYGEWIGRLRDAALRPGTPLVHQNGQWKFVARFEGWYALGPRLFDQHLDRLQKIAVAVLQEYDPQFDLPSDERFAAGVYDKVLSHSHRLRRGLAEALALLGSQAGALVHCSAGKAEATAVLSVRALLSDGDWTRWASLNDVLPLLAEAAPHEFLTCLEDALTTRPAIFDQLFAQEGTGIMGRTYLTGILWSLETLAWEPTLLSRVVMCLGGLAAKDPGGKWANRPDNSLRGILLPWFPQTCAPVSKRGAAVAALLREYPAVGWKLLVNLLPGVHSSSSHTSRPAWRPTIPEEWNPGVTDEEHWEQIVLYADMTVDEAKHDWGRMIELVGHWDHLPDTAHDALYAYLTSSATKDLPDTVRRDLWNSLMELIVKHRRFSDADWAMDAARVDQLVVLAGELTPSAPTSRHQRLFSEHSGYLYEERGNYEEQHQKLEDIRREAVAEVLAEGGIDAVLKFAAVVESPWRVGIALGGIAGPTIDADILPGFLAYEEKSTVQFTGGFIVGRFVQGSWSWVDGVHMAAWYPEQIAQFLSFLPFVPPVWQRAQVNLGDQVKLYWTRVPVNPYQSSGAELKLAVPELLKYGRPRAAVACIHRILHQSEPLDPSVAVDALLAALTSAETTHTMDGYDTVEVIKALQGDPRTSDDDLFRIEWAYLPILDTYHQGSPKFLEKRLSSNPEFFCEVIRLVFRPKGSDAPIEVSEQSQAIATNGYRLLDKWRIPPGMQSDGSLDGAALDRWLNAVKADTAATGHLEVAMTMVGHVLTRVPPDPDGLWIHRAAAAVLNAKDADNLRGGFRTQTMNSRGVHRVDPTGKAEEGLAANYRVQADAVEEAGYQRLATTVREIAMMYEREAEHARSRERSDG